MAFLDHVGFDETLLGQPDVLAQQEIVWPAASRVVDRSVAELEEGSCHAQSFVTCAIGPNQYQAPRTVAAAPGEELAEILDPFPTWP